MSKGSARRPALIDEEHLQEAWDLIFSKPKEDSSEQIEENLLEENDRKIL